MESRGKADMIREKGSRRRIISIVFLFASIVCLYNYFAWKQAKSMMSFSPSGIRSPKPEKLSWFEKISILFTGVTIPRPLNSSTPADIGLLFQKYIFTNQSGDTIEGWHVSKTDSNIIFLCFHGYSSSKASLLPIAKELWDLGWDSFLLDFYGSGESSGSGTTIGIKEAEDVKACYDYCSLKWPDKTIVLYGVSMGGSAVLRAVALYKLSPRGIILESTFDNLLQTVKNRFNAMGIPAFPSAHLILLWGGLQNDVNPFDHNPAEFAKMVNLPVLVLHGQLDQRVSLEEAGQVYANLPGPKQFKSYPGVGHSNFAAIIPTVWRSDIQAFVNDLY